MKNPSDEDPDTTASIEEVKWTDDSIRWEGGLNVKTSTTDEGIDDDDSDDDENYMVDPFAWVNIVGFWWIGYTAFARSVC